MMLSAQDIPLTVLKLLSFSWLLTVHLLAVVDNRMTTMAQKLLSVYQYYEILSIMDSIGSLALTTAMHLSYLTTRCDELASYKETFKDLREYFLKLDLFRLDDESISKALSDLYFEVIDDLKAWNCSQIRYDLALFEQEFQKIDLSRSSPSLINSLKRFSEWLSTPAQAICLLHLADGTYQDSRASA
jgi:hypothetical protein